MNYNNIKLILWDYGGVLTYSPFLNIKNFEKFSNIKQNSIIKINSNKPFVNAWAKLEKNLISFTNAMGRRCKSVSFFKYSFRVCDSFNR